MFEKVKQIPRNIIYYLPCNLRHQFIRFVTAVKNLRPNRGYYCRALGGESNYNICINSDLSVSCNCGDYDGSGHIGDLRKQNLKEIFDGKTARQFRDKLASGKLAIKSCSGCVELESTSRKKALEKSQNWVLPTQGIMVENTVVCNYKCLACDRGVVATRQRVDGRAGGRLMSNLDMEIVAKTVQKYDIKQVCYHNLGEPFLSRDILSEMQTFRKYNPHTHVVVSTNGAFLEHESKLQAAMLFDEIYVSIDGSSQSVVEKYQVGGIFQKSYEGMKGLVKYRNEKSRSKPLIEWKYVVFKWNDGEEEINRAIEMSKTANVDRISFYKGGMPGGKGESWRYHASAFFKKMGNEYWNLKRLDHRPSAKS